MTTHDRTGPSDADAIIEVAKASVTAPTPITPGDVLATDEPIVLTDTEKYAAEPRAKRGTAILHTAASLTQYVNAHKTGATALYADVKDRKIVAVINDHESGPTQASIDGESDRKGDPGWRDHRAELHLRSTPEWDRWMARNGKIGDQVAFAEHIEDSAMDIRSPDPATMLELAQSISATEKVSFQSADRLSDGQRTLIYQQDLNATAGDGNLQVPDTFEIAIAPFEGGARYAMTARLRLRINNGNLAIGYVLDRVEDTLRAAFDELLTGGEDIDRQAESIETLTGLTAYRGSAPNALRS